MEPNARNDFDLPSGNETGKLKLNKKIPCNNCYKGFSIL
jgi:hypothetical protein